MKNVLHALPTTKTKTKITAKILRYFDFTQCARYITLYLLLKKMFAKRCKHYIYNHYQHNWLRVLVLPRQGNFV